MKFKNNRESSCFSTLYQNEYTKIMKKNFELIINKYQLKMHISSVSIDDGAVGFY